MKDVNLCEALLQEQLHRLSRGPGVLRDNLLDWLDSRVHHAFGITDRGAHQSVTAAVSERLLELISRFNAESIRDIALYSFNLTGDPDVAPLWLTDRQKALEQAGGASLRKCVKKLKETIVPELARMILVEAGEAHEHDIPD